MGDSARLLHLSPESCTAANFPRALWFPPFRGLVHGRAGSTLTRRYASPHPPGCSRPPARRRSTPASHAATRDPPHRSGVKDSKDLPHHPPRTLCSALRSHAATRDAPAHAGPARPHRSPVEAELHDNDESEHAALHGKAPLCSSFVQATVATPLMPGPAMTLARLPPLEPPLPPRTLCTKDPE
jgi:hypothetical protein